MKKIIIFLGVLIVLLVPFLFILEENDTSGNDSLNTNEYFGEINPFKIHTITGYHSTYDVLMKPMDYDPETHPLPATTTCHRFTITGGDEYLINHYKDSIRQSLGEYTKPLEEISLNINIDPKELPLDLRDILLNSSTSSPITMDVTMNLEGRELNYCESVVKLISISKNYLPNDNEFSDRSKIRELYGFYSPYERPMMTIDYDPSTDPLPPPITCQAFTVISGDVELINHFTNMVNIGNTVNHLDKKTGMLVLNIELNNYPDNEKNKIVKSTQESPINIQVQLKPESERDAPYCYSFIKLLNTK